MNPPLPFFHATYSSHTTAHSVEPIETFRKINLYVTICPYKTPTEYILALHWICFNTSISYSGIKRQLP